MDHTLETKYNPEERGPLALWAGIECTVNRVGDIYYDQNEVSGHADRLDDLDRCAALGVRTLRYPILWERTAPNGLDSADWSWADTRMERLRTLGIRPIVGLVHHGAGPRDTSLLDPEFPEKLAVYARAVAERYPWANAYTPVNEPLTTARFSCLYGLWHPHATDPLSFIRAVLIECRATVLAMRAIREINPTAQLVQTEDMGKIYSTPTLKYQADFENERRWLSFDLLCGELTPERPMWGYLTYLGISEAELQWFVNNPCPPDILGINHYVTSERFLDERLDHYPEHTHGGNGTHDYADVEAVRVCSEGIAGPFGILGEVWARYRRPIVVTEAHLGCTPDEQMRWLWEVWNAALEARQAGMDVRAVTAWALFGLYDWNSLLTKHVGHYEPGAYDLSGPRPKPTPLARLIRALATEGGYAHPILKTAGWWRRPDRLLYPAFDLRVETLASHPVKTPVQLKHLHLSHRP
ncbi:MAG: family 1 glycosylhydrolase [Capsulimonas sp.]|uniref:family 1 glycosylhydrolase n=1 Tax=Capsulimonas sp. TaxID=2494211 RepID=UPI0032664868